MQKSLGYGQLRNIIGRTVHCKFSPHHIHPGVSMELCKAVALTLLVHVDHQHRHCRRNAQVAWCVRMGRRPTDEEKAIAIAGRREYDALHHCPTPTHAHDRVFCLPRTAFTIIDGTVCPHNHGLRWTTVAHEGIEVSPHRRHGVVCAAVLVTQDAGKQEHRWRGAADLSYGAWRRLPTRCRKCTARAVLHAQGWLGGAGLFQAVHNLVFVTPLTMRPLANSQTAADRRLRVLGMQPGDRLSTADRSLCACCLCLECSVVTA